MVDDEERIARMLRLVHIGKDRIDSLSKSRTQVHSGGYQPPTVFVGWMLGMANGPMRAYTSFGTP
jgi:hypothetical protein